MEGLKQYCRDTSDKVRSEGNQVDYRSFRKEQRDFYFEEAYNQFVDTVTRDYECRFKHAAESGLKGLELFRYKRSDNVKFGHPESEFYISTILKKGGLRRLRKDFFDNQFFIDLVENRTKEHSQEPTYSLNVNFFGNPRRRQQEQEQEEGQVTDN